MADMKLVTTGSSSDPPSLMGAAMRSSCATQPLPPNLGLHSNGTL